MSQNTFPEFNYSLEDREQPDFSIPKSQVPVLKIPILDEIRQGGDKTIEGEYEQELVETAAEDMIYNSLEIKESDVVVIGTTPGAEQIVGALLKRLRDIKCKHRLLFYDLFVESQIDKPEVMRAYLQRKLVQLDDASKYIGVRCGFDPDAGINIKDECKEEYIKGFKTLGEKVINYPEKLVRCVTQLPTEWQAKADGYTFEKYKELYKNAVKQPWKEIQNAQADFIEKKLNPGGDLVIIIDPINGNDKTATHLTMSIEGMTFANSGIQRNYPGSEMFSAPVLESVEGTVFFEGNFVRQNKVMSNICLKFKKGEIVEATAEKGIEDLEEILSKDGAKRVGEIGIGTNPGLTTPMFSNSLLVEKVGGTFHLALGQAYEISTYDGKPIKVDNGNDSSIHWDITCVNNMRNNSRMFLDGELVRFNGCFLGQEYSVLNPDHETIHLDDVPTEFRSL